MEPGECGEAREEDSYVEELPEMTEEEYLEANGNGDECMVVDLQENEFGDIIIVSKDGNIFASAGRADGVVDELTERDGAERLYAPGCHPDEKIEIVCLPVYEDINGEVVVKRECDVESYEPEVKRECDVESYEPEVKRECRDESYDRPATNARHKQARSKRAESSTRPSLLRRPCKASAPPRHPDNLARQDKPLSSRSSAPLRHPDSLARQDTPWPTRHDKPWLGRDFDLPSSISSVTTIHVASGAVGAAQPAPAGAAAVRPHKCGYCDQAYREAASLSLHLTQFHKVLPDSCAVS